MKTAVKKLLILLAYGLIIYFISTHIVNNWQSIRTATLHLHYGWAITSLIVAAGTVVFQSYVWHRLLRLSRHDISFTDAFTTFSQSIVARYLPGWIWVFFARTYQTAKLGVQKTQVLYLLFIESALGVLTGSFLYLIIRPHTIYALYLDILAVLLVIIMITFLWLPKKFIMLYERLFKKHLSIIPIPLPEIFYICVLFFIQWILFGFSFFLFIKAVAPILPHQYFNLTGIYVVSWVVGFIVIFAPSGLGIRESLLILLLATTVSTPIAVMIPIGIRMITMMGEAICFFASFCFSHPSNILQSNIEKNNERTI